MRAASPLSGQVPLLFLLAFLGTAWPQRVGSDSVRIAARAKMLVDRARFQAENAEVHCQDVRDCPDAVGLWAATTGKSSFQCTAFLIDSIHAVTDRHCIPQDLQSEGRSCRDRAWLHLPSASGVKGEVLGCDRVEILSRTDARVGDPDYAVVRLQRASSRQPLKVERGPLADLDTVEVVRVKPMEVEAALRDVPVGAVGGQSCLVSRLTRSFADHDMKVDVLDPLSRRVPLVDCPAEGGNSGSPVLVKKADGTKVVRALLDRTVDVHPVEDWARNSGIRLLDGKLAPIAWAGSFACLPLPGDTTGWVAPRSCRVDSSFEAMATETSRWKSEVDGALDGMAQTWGKGRGIRFSGGIFRPREWPDLQHALKCEADLPDAFVVPVPVCLEPGTVITKGNDDGTIPVWDVVFGFDRRLRWGFRVHDRMVDLPVKFAVTPDRNGARVALEMTRPNGQPLVLCKKQIPRCGKPL